MPGPGPGSGFDVRLGNVAAKGARVSYDDDGNRLVAPAPLAGNRVTYVGVPGHNSLLDAFVTITAGTGVWANQSFAPPAWVESDSPALAQMLAEHYGCPIGRPDDMSDWRT